MGARTGVDFYMNKLLNEEVRRRYIRVKNALRFCISGNTFPL